MAPKRTTSLLVRCLILLSLCLSFIAKPQVARAEAMREFVMSCSYGVLAGTLVGAATLAFSDRPGDNLNKVARGASIGLYAGILLGLYVVYGVPSGEGDEEPVALLNPDGERSLTSNDFRLMHSAYAGALSLQRRELAGSTLRELGLRNSIAKAESAQSPFQSSLMIAPIFSEQDGLSGASAQLSLAHF